PASQRTAGRIVGRNLREDPRFQIETDVHADRGRCATLRDLDRAEAPPMRRGDEDRAAEGEPAHVAVVRTLDLPVRSAVDALEEADLGAYVDELGVVRMNGGAPHRSRRQLRADVFPLVAGDEG